MPEKMNKNWKSAEAEAIAAFIMRRHKPDRAPRLVMWRDVVNEYAKAGHNAPMLGTRDSGHVHRHFKLLGPGVIKILEDRHSLTIVRVGNSIRDLIKHGDTPDRGGRRTDEAYRRCLATSRNPTMGFVAFPPDSHHNHPLVLDSRRRRAGAAISATGSAFRSIDAATDRGLMSPGARAELYSFMDDNVRRLNGQSLAPRAIVGPSFEVAAVEADDATDRLA